MLSTSLRSSDFTTAYASERIVRPQVTPLEQGALLQFQIPLDQRRTEPSRFHIEAEHTTLAKLLEARPAGGQQFLGGGPLVGARHLLDRGASGRKYFGV